MSPQQKICLIFLNLYKYCISPFFGNCCRFYPSCSDYARDAIIKYGLLKGSFLTAGRILRCNPFSPGGEDNVK